MISLTIIIIIVMDMHITIFPCMLMTIDDLIMAMAIMLFVGGREGSVQ